ncbi:efflux RND transporter periplasmic adaptor subunit [Dickeya sp. CFBP 2040]|uniref:Efflux RND transporter periplasmic adaptor subunit n=1 Tax=Dickeya poaceiphila TaxID=568768 RepID=A0A5B8IA09_9GAMM|nr:MULTISPECIES: efflux RND transporter periplasmic adaptor subunit [Dickeya]NKI73916.1 efflux RND transporter periplasmic adaptor subunit [Dickeya sp. CFBP 2040]QDX30558.1 efflux RND transporter periplasmic adaptor subunit [Dickeya poaceiphila]
MNIRKTPPYPVAYILSVLLLATPGETQANGEVTRLPVSLKQLCRHGVLLALVGLLLAGCDQRDAPVESPPAKVTVMAAKPMPITLTDDLPGRVTAVRTAEIRPQVGGIIQRRLFEQGAEIRAGQPLFQINPAPFNADVDTASAALQRAQSVLNRAQIQVARLKPLLSTGAISQQTYDDAIAQRDQAAADVAQARATLARRQLDLTFATVESPIAGRIDQALITEGALVSTNDSTPLARVQQIDQVYVDVRQPASSLEQLRDMLNKHAGSSDGIPVVILRSDGTPYPMSARILFSGMNVDTGTGDVLLRILVDNPQRQLLPGMFVRARIPFGHYPDALLVPQQAVTRNGGEAKIWVVDEQNTAHAITVEPAELINRQYRIRAGLNAGQQVVIEGGERLSEGSCVATQHWKKVPSATDVASR